MDSYLWPLVDIIISVLMYFIYKREVRRVRDWRTRQHKAVNSGEYNSSDMGRVVLKLRSLESQQPRTGLGIALGMWPLFFLGVLIFSGTVMPLQPDQIPPKTLPWTIGIWAGFLMFCLIPWLFGFAVLWPGNAIQVVMDNGILNLRLFRGAVFIGWDKVKNVYVTHSNIGEWYFYVTTRQGTMIIGHRDKNIKKFAEVIMKNLPQDKWARVEEYLLAATQQDSPEVDQNGILR